MGLGIFSWFRTNSATKAVDTAWLTLERAQNLKRKGDLTEAKALCLATLAQQPDHAESLLLLGELESRLGNTASALDAFSSVIALQAADATAYYKRGNLLKDGGDLQAALLDYERAIERNSDHAHAFCNRGVVLEQLGRLDLALESLTRATELDPRDALSLFNRAEILRKLKKFDAALDCYDAAVAINSMYFEAYCNRGALLTELKRWDAALLSFDRSIELAPSFAPAYFNRAALHYKRKRRKEAMADYNRAITLLPDYAEAYAGRGVLWAELAVYDSALADYHRAITLNPKHAEAHFLLADILFQKKKFEAAIASYDCALALDENLPYVLGMRRHAKMSICDWSGLDTEIRQIIEGVEAGKKVTPPFPLTALIGSAALQRTAAEIYIREEYPQDSLLGDIARRVSRPRITVGYFSADFRAHPVALLTAELFELHDRSRFEVIAFAFGPESTDATRVRLQQGFDRFIDVRHLSDVEIAKLSRELEVDIAVDLGGFTAYSRTGIFALRAAPLQVSYIGYLGTIGATYMDYLIADKTIIPESDQHHYSEKIIYLPSYQVNDSRRQMSARRFTRSELGLPEDGFVFCCLNATYKITPPTFALWMRILGRVPHSCLYLYVNDESARNRLSKQAEYHGVEASRICFAEHIPVEDYLARFCSMNLFLDTLPYNAGTTASDALWAGLPVLTCIGESFAGRVAASLLNSLDLSEMVTETEARYEALAVELATNAERMMEVNNKLSRNRDTAVLFDTPRFVASLERAFEQIQTRVEAGLPLENIYQQS